jgi:uncharacterized protein YndB with AHSA1/START domain
MIANSGSSLTVTLPSERSIQLAREFDAPRELVYAAFTTCEHITRWLRPKDMTVSECKMDMRPGGTWRFVHRDNEGHEFGFHGEIREVVPPQRIVRTFEFEGMPGHVALETLTLAGLGGRTRLIILSEFESVEDRDGMLQSGMEQGASESYAHLADYLHELEGREIVLSRVFEAPRELVFRAWTDQRHIAEWWGPNGFTTTVHEMDVRPGGRWRFVMHGPDGVDYPNLVEFSEVVAPERLVFRHGSGAADDPGFEVITTFAEEAGKTRLTLRQIHASAEARDLVVREYHAIEMGNQTLDRFAAYLASVAARS